MTKIAINGLGRIGKLVLRAFIEDGVPGTIVFVNEPGGDAAQLAMLAEFDSVHGRWDAAFSHD
ncbi:MAG: glyceraldehyde 3-phosphate dehydrogenase NAD-binding domain-containing protein, partial [Pseudomonadota bacterium]